MSAEPIFVGGGKNDRHVVLPAAARLVTSQYGKKDKWSFHYEEDFVDPPLGLIERTTEALTKTLAKSLPQLKVRTRRRQNVVTVVLHGRGLTRAQIGDMMAGEFFAWGSFGRMSMSDLLGLSVYAQAQLE